ncbi:MAG: hypothetical protein WC269_00135 [Candidatus Gracilibacteria bacterium]|jgi:hypothetical protein
MKKKSLLIAVLVITLVMVAAVTAFAVNGSNLKGLLTTSTSSAIPSPLTVTLNPASPSGSRTVSSNDTVAIFDLCNVTAKDVTVAKIAWGFRSNGGIDFDLGVKLMEQGSTIGTSNINSRFGDLLTLSTDLIISGGQCKSVSIVTDTAFLLAEQPGMDDTLQASLLSVKNKGTQELLRAEVLGNILRY